MVLLAGSSQTLSPFFLKYFFLSWQGGADFRSNYLLNSSIVGIESADLVLIVSAVCWCVGVLRWRWLVFELPAQLVHRRHGKRRPRSIVNVLC